LKRLQLLRPPGVAEAGGDIAIAIRHDAQSFTTVNAAIFRSPT
jgi:hypothetical protein